MLLNFSQICNEELFGEVAEEKEVEGIRGKLKEAKSTKSYDIYKIISRFVTKETLPNLVLPLKEVFQSSYYDLVYLNKFIYTQIYVSCSSVGPGNFKKSKLEIELGST